jgi:succinoglycan biosynthesis transport protein ExoP
MKERSSIGNRLPRLAGNERDVVRAGPVEGEYRVLSAVPLYPPEASTNAIADLIAAARRHKWVVVASVATFASAALLFAHLAKPLYVAEGLMLLATEKSQVTDFKSVVSGLPLEAATVRSEIEILKSPALAEKVVDKLKLWNEPAYQQNDGPSWLEKLEAKLPFSIEDLKARLGLEKPVEMSPAAKEALRRKSIVAAVAANLDAVFDGRSYVVRLRFPAPDPDLAARIVNTFMQIRIADQQTTKSEATRRGGEWLDTRLAELRAQVEIADKAVETYRAAHNLTQPKGTTLTAQQLTELNSQLVLASAERAQKEATLRQVRELLKSPDGVATAGQVLASPIIQRLSDEETDVVKQIANESVVYGDKHPKIIQLKSQAHELKRRMTSEVSKVVQSLYNELTVAQAREAQLKARLDSTQRDNNVIGAAEVKLLELQRQADANRRIYETFLTRQLEIKDQDKIIQADARIVSPAEAPIFPSYPQKSMVTLLASGAGLVIGIFLALLRERTRQGFRQTSEVENATGLPSLGFIPAVRRSRHALALLTQQPRSSFSEAVRSIRATLSVMDFEHKGKIILVTSSVAGEGKSLFSAALAKSIALAGWRALLIDCDLRRPATRRLLSGSPGPGLVELLSGQASVDGAIRGDGATGLHYLSAMQGKHDGSPQDLLGSRAMRTFMTEIRDDYDIIVLDAPPVLPVSDAVVLSEYADACIFVIRWLRTPREAVQNALDILANSATPLLGAVLSRVNAKRHARLGFRDSPAYHGRYGAAYYR